MKKMLLLLAAALVFTMLLPTASLAASTQGSAIQAQRSGEIWLCKLSSSIPELHQWEKASLINVAETYAKEAECASSNLVAATHQQKAIEATYSISSPLGAERLKLSS